MPFTGMVVGPKAATRATRLPQVHGPPDSRQGRDALHHEPHEVVVAALATRDRLLVGARHQDSDEPVVTGTATQHAGTEAAEEEVDPRASDQGVGALSAAHHVVPAQSLDPVVASESRDHVVTLRAHQHIVTGGADDRRRPAPTARRCSPGATARTAVAATTRSAAATYDVVALMSCPTLERLAWFTLPVA